MINQLISHQVLSETKKNASKSLRRRLFLDPKTVESKDNEANFPYVDDFANLRYAAFGTSRTFGVGTNDRISETYPSLLSMGKADNYAIRATGPEYPAFCLYSMIGDNHYDVIILEYESYVQSVSQKCVDIRMLVQRLRNRFPAAIILFLQDFLPMNYKHKSNSLPLRDWKLPDGTPGRYKLRDPSNIALLKDDEWEVVENEGICDVEDLAREFNATLMTIDRPSTIRETFHAMRHYYIDDMTHWTPQGHMYIAEHIHKKLLEIPSYENNSQVKPWPEKDRCEWWFESGKTQFESSSQMKPFGVNKFAYEFSEDGYVKIVNSIGSPAQIFVQYMITYPEQKYFNATVSLRNSVEVPAENEVKLWTSLSGAGAMIHISKLSEQIGIIEGNESFLYIRPQNDHPDGNLWPFRIIGILMVPVGFGDKIAKAQIKLGSYLAENSGDGFM